MKTNDKNKYKDFGDRLSLIMYKQNISNIQLANAMFVSPSTISGYRTGRRSEHALFPERCSTLFYKSCSASKITVERSGTRTRV